MQASLKTAFIATVGSAAIAGAAFFLPGVFRNAARPEAPQEDITIAACQPLDAPLAHPDTIEQRRLQAHKIIADIRALEKINKTAQRLDSLEKERDSLLAPNILDGMRRELILYAGWDDLKKKLARNGKELRDVCLNADPDTPLPIILQSGGTGDSELDLNTIAKDINLLQDGHVLERLSVRSLAEMDEILTPNLANQAIYYMTLFGTTSSGNPAFSLEQEPEDIAMLWTIWQALAAAEQMLHAADYHLRTGDIRSFDASYDIQPYQHYLVSELSLQAMEHRKNGTAFSAEDRRAFKQKAVREALENREVRMNGFLSILAEAQAQDDKSALFRHRVTDKELSKMLNRLDPDIAALPVRDIYARWHTDRSDPARKIKPILEALKSGDYKPTEHLHLR